LKVSLVTDHLTIWNYLLPLIVTKKSLEKIRKSSGKHFHIHVDVTMPMMNMISTELCLYKILK